MSIFVEREIKIKEKAGKYYLNYFGTFFQDKIEISNQLLKRNKYDDLIIQFPCKGRIFKLEDRSPLDCDFKNQSGSFIILPDDKSLVYLVTVMKPYRKNSFKVLTKGTEVLKFKITESDLYDQIAIGFVITDKIQPIKIHWKSKTKDKTDYSEPDEGITTFYPDGKIVTEPIWFGQRYFYAGWFYNIHKGNYILQTTLPHADFVKYNWHIITDYIQEHYGEQNNKWFKIPTSILKSPEQIRAEVKKERELDYYSSFSIYK